MSRDFQTNNSYTNYNIKFEDHTYSCANGVDLVCIIIESNNTHLNVLNFFLQDDLSLFETKTTSFVPLHQVSFMYNNF